MGDLKNTTKDGVAQTMLELDKYGQFEQINGSIANNLIKEKYFAEKTKFAEGREQGFYIGLCIGILFMIVQILI